MRGPLLVPPWQGRAACPVDKRGIHRGPRFAFDRLLVHMSKQRRCTAVLAFGITAQSILRLEFARVALPQSPDFHHSPHTPPRALVLASSWHVAGLEPRWLARPWEPRDGEREREKDGERENRLLACVCSETLADLAECVSLSVPLVGPIQVPSLRGSRRSGHAIRRLLSSIPIL